MIYDLTIVGAGPVGLMSAYLAHLSGLKVFILDKSHEATQFGRADALNARTLQLLNLVGLFDEIYPMGKPCSTSSIYENGKIISRKSHWWDSLEGCLHKHFLMLGQNHLEELLNKKLSSVGINVQRSISVENIELNEDQVQATLSDGRKVNSRYLLGADGGKSFVRKFFKVPFEVTLPKMGWAILEGVIKTDFKKAPEIVVFQNSTADIAWIPREGDLDRFYIRIDEEGYDKDVALKRLKDAFGEHGLEFQKITWESYFEVKESVAENFIPHERVILAGDACHIHSVNGGQGLNTGLGDAFNLIWRIKNNSISGYGAERKLVALDVVNTSAELLRSTKYAEGDDHAQTYLGLLERKAGFITGMGVKYGVSEYGAGSRLHDFKFKDGSFLYQKLDYNKFTFIKSEASFENIEEIISRMNLKKDQYQVIELEEISSNHPYYGKTLFVRPDTYIESVFKNRL